MPHRIQTGDRVELFAVYPDRWVSRGDGVVQSWHGETMAYVDRGAGAHGVMAMTRPTLYGTVMVLEVPSDCACQCILPAQN